MTDLTPELPPRPSSQTVAAVLIEAANGAPLLADQPVSEIGHGLQYFSTASGWQLAIWWSPGPVMGPLAYAINPQGQRWVYGCARWPDWNAGPDAVVLDPIRHLLDDDQRSRLQARLITCNCWPTPVRQVMPEPPSMSEIMELWGDDLTPG